MNPDADMSQLTLLLYLLAFAAAAAGMLIPLLPRINPDDKRSRNTGFMLQGLVITGLLPSLQVILDALEISPNLPGSWPLVLNLVFNVLIIAGITASSLLWYRMAQAFAPSAFYADRITRLVVKIAYAVAAVSLISQTLAALLTSREIIGIAGTSLLILVILLTLVVTAGFLRVIRPGKGAGTSRTGLIVKGLIPFVLLFIILHMLLPDRIANVLIPLALTSVFTLTILLYVWQNTESGDSESVLKQLFEDAALTNREQEIAMMLAEGLSYKEISAKLFVSLSTVQTHVTRIYGKLDVKSKTELSRKIIGK